MEAAEAVSPAVAAAEDKKMGAVAPIFLYRFVFFSIFAGCCAHDLPESLGEIAHLLETAVRTDVCDLPVRGLELLRCPLDPVILGVLDGCQADGVVEAAQAFAGADEGGV